MKLDLKKPSMVLFDFGGTLFYDGKMDFISGAEKVRLAADNPDVTTAQEMKKVWDMICNDADDFLGNNGKYKSDYYVDSVFRHIFARTGLKYSIHMSEIVRIFDENNSSREQTPNMELFLKTLGEKNIRTAVISNVKISAEVMKVSLDKGYPNNKFEFVITSADYLFCKPAPYMFESAAALAKLSPEDCWYCGDCIEPDVFGSGSVGMKPFLFNKNFEKELEKKNHEGIDYYALNDWKHLAKAVKEM